MSRFALDRRVFFFEEPVFEDGQPHLRGSICSKTGVRVYTPILPPGLNRQEISNLQNSLLELMLGQNEVDDYMAWYYTPMAMEYAFTLRPKVTVYDCMDELSAFSGAPAAMRHNEEALFAQADLVFTGGASLFDSKRRQHPSAHLFPSSIDFAHFAGARLIKRDPEDQAALGRPRLGYAGVIDERMDLDLLRYVAGERPDWQIVLLGPIAKIDPASLPQARNIHYLGMKPYAELPAYFSGWDIGMLPFALSESTQFISPTKTPEYLAAGLQVVSTPIRDVISSYGDLDLVGIANGASEFITVAESLLQRRQDADFRDRADRFLSKSSWDRTWSNMNGLMEQAYMSKYSPAVKRPPVADISAKGASHV
ncbi:MAG: hypothetical protein WB992_12030 [Bryobacteraceae bacterium]